MTRRMHVCLIPQALWKAPLDGNPHASFKALAEDARANLRRIHKNADREREEMRFARTCTAIEARAVEISKEIEFGNNLSKILNRGKPVRFSLQVPPKAIESLASSCFILPEEMDEGPEKKFPEELADVLAAAKDSQSSMVVLFDPFEGGRGASPPPPPEISHLVPEGPEEEAAPRPARAKTKEAGAKTSSPGSRSRLLEMLSGRIEEALAAGGRAVNLSSQPNDVLTEALRRHVESEDGGPPGNIRVLYTDGSEAPPFPLRCLPKAKGSKRNLPSRHLRASLISMRHPEMDVDVDFAWFRNWEASQGRPHAETDRFCYEASLRQLTSLVSSDPLALRMYQTGLEPAVVGFYRALTQVLREGGRGKIAVVPMYFRGASEGEGTYEEGTPWS